MTKAYINFLETVNADIALETPQTKLDWTYDSAKLAEYKPSQIDIRRSTERFPEDISEGTSVLSEAIDLNNPRVFVADTGVDADTMNYYSTFITHKNKYILTGYDSTVFDISRFGEIIDVTHYPYHAIDEVIAAGPVTPIAGTLNNLVIQTFSIRFQYTVAAVAKEATSSPSNWYGDPGAGVGSINYQTGVYTFTPSGAASTITASYLYLGDPTVGDFYRCWLLGKDVDGNSCIMAYNTASELIDEKYLLDGILDVGETIKYLAGYDVNHDSPYEHIFHLVTNKRYINLQITPISTPYTVLSTDINSEFDWNGKLPSGYDIKGACTDYRAADLPDYHIRILDRGNALSRMFDTSGTTIFTNDMSGMDTATLATMKGLFADLQATPRYYFGHENNWLAIVSTVAAPTSASITSAVPVGYDITAGSDYIKPVPLMLHGKERVIQYFTYKPGFSSYWQQEEEIDPIGQYALAIWHCNEDPGTATSEDSSGNGNTASIASNTSIVENGKFGNCVYSSAASGTSGITSAALKTALIGATTITISYWYKVPYAGYLSTTGTKNHVYLSATNPALLYIRTTPTNLEVYVNTAINPTTLQSGQATIDTLNDGYWHNILVIVNETVGNTIDLYIDGVYVTQTALNTVPTWAGIMTQLWFAHDVGYYDDFYISDNIPNIYDATLSPDIISGPFTCFAISGRDYSTSTSFSFRNNLRRYLGETILEEDYNRIVLPTNKVLSNYETIFREPVTDMNLGELGRLSRFFGLMIDRLVDKRKHFLNKNLLIDTCDYDYLYNIAYALNAYDFEDDWNVDKIREYIKVLYSCYKFAGNISSFERLIHCLGFKLWIPTTADLFVTSRGYFDSVVDPLRADVYLDTGHFDSAESSASLVTEYFTFYQESFSGTDGATTLANTFDSAGADFLADMDTNGMLWVYDQDDDGDNGMYQISTIATANQITVSPNFTTGGLTNLSYKVYWKVPESDPYVNWIISKLNKIKVNWQKIVYSNTPIT